MEEIIDHYKDTINYYIEVKRPEDNPGMADELLQVLNSRHLIENNIPRGKVIIQSSDAESLKYIHSQYPNLPLIQLGSYTNRMDLPEISKYAIGVGPELTTVNKTFIEKAHSNGLIVHCWTVNNQADMEKMIDWGADGIFTNYVGLAVNVKLADRTAPVIPTIYTTSDHSTSIMGTAESKSTVYAWVGNKMLGKAVASNEKYSIKISKQKAGALVSVYSVDAAGNKSGSKTGKVVDRTAPVTPTINIISDQSTYIAGKAELNSKVYAWVGTEKLGVATTSNGKYSIKISKQKAGALVSVYSVDAAGNISSKKTVKTLDRTAPKIPAINKITSKTKYIKGKAEKKATVYVFNKSQKVGKAKVDNKGNFNVKIKAQKKKSQLKIYVIDGAGNKSKIKVIRVY
ncbi:Ig-like domain-containing protein [Neobacillus drentensis]|uniref:Ig-like domain-containing protein n=1 Tax=Neobacillus drentensis TaxID=220684 RepID=UPI003000F4C8